MNISGIGVLQAQLLQQQSSQQDPLGQILLNQSRVRLFHNTIRKGIHPHGDRTQGWD